jgi:sigma-B regulation protein RsbU (phosphoserine phosphatase)
MSNLQAMVRSLVTGHPDPSAILGRINFDLSSRIGENIFITCCFLTLSPENGNILYANAGHNEPLICSNNGDISSLEVSGIPLGILRDSSYETFNTALEPGDVLLLYTDGITECANKTGDLFGDERLKSVLSAAAAKDAAAIRTAICTAVDSFRIDQPHSDDMTFVVVKRKESIS